jgi:thiosulfate/3-mercaptopyruvate sulfurtransferase
MPAPSPSEPASSAVPLPGPLVDADRLGDHRSASGRQGWAERHLPGSRHADLTGDLSDPAAPYHFAMPTLRALATALERLGVRDGSTVVAYDSGGIWAASTDLALPLLGREDVSIYDGPLEEWSEAEERPLTLRT